MKWQIQVGKEIIEKYNSGMGVATLSQIYNIKKANIRHFLKTHNKEKWRGGRIYSLDNENYFEKIDTNNKAYLLGFLCADGHVSEKSAYEGFSIEIQARDKEILEYFMKELGSNKPDKIRLRKNKRYYAKIVILSVKIRQDLNNLGIRHNKTYNLEMPIIEQKYMSHFIRGFFDGDGCLCIPEDPVYSSFSIISTTSMCNAIHEIFKKELNTESKVVKVKQCVADISQIFVYGNRQIQKILEYIYQDADLFLTRKMNKYIEFQKARVEHSHESTMKLSLEQVQEIRKRIDNKETYRSIAKDYGVSSGPIGSIKSGASYRDYK